MDTIVKKKELPKPVYKSTQETQVLNVCSNVVSCELMTQSISQTMFQSNFPPNNQFCLQTGLMSLVGQQPPQFVKDNFE